MDGTPTLHLNEFMLATIAHKIDLGPKRTTETGSDLPDLVELEFELNEEVKGLVKEAESRFDDLVRKHDLHVHFFKYSLSIRGANFNLASQVLHYEEYGKDYIKKFKASPDAWAQAAQLVKQLAFHKIFSRPGVTYESAQTRKYQLGRTEVIRIASNETKQWAEAMLNPHETVSAVDL